MQLLAVVIKKSLSKQNIDPESVALHESLYELYRGRLRLKILGLIAVMFHPFAAWIIEPFNRARAHIDNAKDISLHSRIDVLAYRAVALASLRRCGDLREDVAEVTRLITILGDDARTRHWRDQQKEIQRYCQ